MATLSKLRGTVKSIKRAEGYGFITHTATGDDHFFHRSQVVGGGFEGLEVDDAVEFVASEGPKGPRATEVRPLQSR